MARREKITKEIRKCFEINKNLKIAHGYFWDAAKVVFRGITYRKEKERLQINKLPPQEPRIISAS